MIDCKLMKDDECTCNMECSKHKAFRQGYAEALNDCWHSYDKLGRGAFEEWMQQRIKEARNGG